MTNKPEGAKLQEEAIGREARFFHHARLSGGVMLLRELSTKEEPKK
jgi:hypothetical protein